MLMNPPFPDLWSKTTAGCPREKVQALFITPYSADVL